MQKYCYLNGKILLLNQASLPLNDIGVLRGYGVFDFLRTYSGQPFQFNEHWQRFINSARCLNLKIPVSAAGARQLLKKLMAKNNLTEATARFVLTGGISQDSLHFNKTKPNFFIILDKIPPRQTELYQKGGKLLLVGNQRELAPAKTNSYLTSVKFKNSPHSSQIVDLLYYDRGHILEGSTCNFFLIRRNVLITPKADILAGITRNFVLKLARKIIKVEERLVKLTELKTADEAFITTTTKEIMPIVKISRLKIGSSRPGEKTKLLMKLFKEKTQPA